MHMSFSEILVILFVALLVIKPERLPETAFAMGRWVKWFRSTAAKIKQEIEAPLEQLMAPEQNNAARDKPLE
jgi:Sec-independent protein translocase protein TatA